MLDTPKITHSAAQLTAVIRLTILREEIRQVMGPGIRELMATACRLGRVQRLGRRQRAQTGPEPLGGLHDRPGVEPRPCELAYGAESTADRLRSARPG